jgi:hypothetical protein
LDNPNIREQIRQIMRSEELSSAEKLDSLRALMSADTCKIDNLNQATPAEFRKLKDGLAITDAMQQLRARNCRQRIAAWRALNALSSNVGLGGRWDADAAEFIDCGSVTTF